MMSVMWLIGSVDVVSVMFAAHFARESHSEPMIEHTAIYQFDASSDAEISLAVDDTVWVSGVLL